MNTLRTGSLWMFLLLCIMVMSCLPATADDTYVINLGYYNCDHMTAAPIAKDAGIFDELGLTVNVTGNGKVPEAMAAGRMDAGYIGTEGLMRAFLKGAPILVTANNHLGGSVYLVVSNDIKDPKDLLGKKVALGTEPEKYSSSWINMAIQLGLPWEGSKYETFKMNDMDEYLALKTGRLVGMQTCDPWGSMAEYENTGHIIAMEGKLPGGTWGSCCVYSMNKNFIAEHPDLAKKMILAHTKAIQYIYLHPLKAAGIFAKNYMVPEEVALMTIYKKTVKEGRTLTWEINKDYMNNEIAFELDVKTLDKAPNVDDFISLTLLEESGADNFTTFIDTRVEAVFPLGIPYEDWKKKAFEVEAESI